MSSTFDGSRLSTGEHTHTEGSSPPAASHVATDNLPISWEMVVDALRRHTASGAEDDQLAGMISIGDVVKAQYDRLTMENHYLKEYLHS